LSEEAAVGAAPEPLVQLRGISKGFVEGGLLHPVLEGVDLDVAAGEIVTLLGRSGSGKSTLLNLLSGIDLPTAGQVLLRGEDLARLTERERTLLRRHQIGFVFQFFNLIPTLTVEENLLLPLELAGRLDRRQRERALGLLDFVGLADRLGSYPDVLSGGEQQRVAIARALAHDPLLLLADEPTGNLDAETAGQVLELLAGSVREAGKTLVMATHSREVAALGDRVLRVQEGHLVEIPDA
jgi:putative ABC transport system ATP-binding protein